MKVFSTVLKLGVGFAVGYAVAVVPKEKMRPALKQVVKAGAAAQSTIRKAVSTAAEEVEDILAEIRAEETARAQENRDAQPEPPKVETALRPVVKEAVRLGKAVGASLSKAASDTVDELKSISLEVERESALEAHDNHGRNQPGVGV